MFFSSHNISDFSVKVPQRWGGLLDNTNSTRSCENYRCSKQKCRKANLQRLRVIWAVYRTVQAGAVANIDKRWFVCTQTSDVSSCHLLTDPADSVGAGLTTFISPHIHFNQKQSQPNDNSRQPWSGRFIPKREPPSSLLCFLSWTEAHRLLSEWRSIRKHDAKQI